MAKFHINKHGVPAICKAKPGNCPLGGDEQHFNSEKEAQVSIDKKNEANFGLLPNVKEYNPTEEELNNLKYKEASIKLKNGIRMDGLIGKTDWNKGVIEFRAEGHEEKDTHEIDINDIKNMKASEHPYYSRLHEEELRKNKRAREQFRFAEDELNEYNDKYVMVNYDGKEFDGHVIGASYYHKHDCGLIIQDTTDGSVKHIKNYRMTDLQMTGNNKNEHFNYKKTLELEDELSNYYDEYTTNDNIQYIDTIDTTPDEEIDKYFEASIKKHNGENVDLSKYNFSWEKEVDNNKDSYMSDKNYYDYEHGGGQSQTWDDNSEEAYYEDINKATDIDEFYKGRKEYIDFMVNKVQEVDWTKYDKKQKQGEIDALNHLRKSGIATDI